MNTRQKIEVMQAYLAGKALQVMRKTEQGLHVYPLGVWSDRLTPAEPIWNFCDYDYRVKPVETVKVERYAVIDCDGDISYTHGEQQLAEYKADERNRNGMFAPYHVVKLTGTYTPDA